MHRHAEATDRTCQPLRACMSDWPLELPPCLQPIGSAYVNTGCQHPADDTCVSGCVDSLHGGLQKTASDSEGCALQ